MDAKLTQPRTTTAHYVLNRRAALVLGTAFLVLGAAIGTVVLWHLSPDRRLTYLRESASTYIQQNKWPQAVIQLRNVIQVTPDDVDALYELGKVQLKIYEEAMAGVSLSELQPSEASAGKAAAALEAATACFRRVTQIDPQHWEAQRWLLEFDLRVGDWKDALARLQVLQQAGRRHPLATLAWELMPSAHTQQIEQAKQALAQGDFEQASRLLEPIVESAPLDLDAVEVLCLAHAKQNDDRWQELLAETEKQMGNSARVDLIRAECWLIADRLDAAEHYAQRATRRPHVEVPARFLLASIYGSRAKSSGSTAEWEAAADQFKSILRQVPWDQAAANNLAWVLGVRLQRLAEGLAVSGAALAVVKDPDPNLLDTHGWLLLESGEIARSILFLERAARAAPDDPLIQSHLAAAYRKAGRSTDSITTTAVAECAEEVASDRREPEMIVPRLQLYLSPTPPQAQPPAPLETRMTHQRVRHLEDQR